MATKLDESFVSAAKEKHPQAVYFIDTLAEEVRRLETLCGRYESALEKVATCKDDDHPVLKLLGGIAADALKGHS